MRFELPDELKFITNSRLPQKHTDERLDGKICLITGATSGVGYQGAIHLAKAGAHIIMIARNRDKAEKLCEEIKDISGKKGDYRIADFTRLGEVRKAVGSILAAYPAIHILINSAGVHFTHRTLTEAGHETVFCVNHLASFLVTRLMLDRMIASAPSRIIQVNSEGHRFNGLRINDLNWEKRPYIGLGGYGAAKTAQLLTMWEFNDMLKGSGVTINAIHPGAVKTNIGNNNGFLYRLYLHNILWHFLKEPGIAGDALHYLAASPELADISGKFYNLTHEEVPASHARNRTLGKYMFKKSDELTTFQKDH